MLQRSNFQKLLPEVKKKGIKLDKDIIDIVGGKTPPFLGLMHKGVDLLSATKNWVDKVTTDKSRLLIDEMSDAFFINWSVFTLRKNDRKKFVESKIYTDLKERLRLLEKGTPRE